MRYVHDGVLKVYTAMPVWSRSLASTLYGALKLRKEHTPEFVRLLRGLEATQWWPIDKLESLQSDRLSALVRHAATRVPYYRRLFAEYGLSPGQIQAPSDLEKLPLLTKDIIRAKGTDLLAEGYRMSSLRSESTSGTSGLPLTVYMNHEAYLSTKAVQWLQHGWAEYRHQGEWVGVIAGYQVVPLERRRPPFWITNYAGRMVHFSTYHLKPELMSSMVRQMKKARIQYLIGYPSAISLLAHHIIEHGEEVPLKGVFPSSEPVLKWQQEVIARAFGCRIYNYYGQGEKAVSGTGCGTSLNLHVNMEVCVAECQDARPQSEYKLIVGTPLFNYAMPLLRYALNDLTRGELGTCPCGRAHMLLGPVETIDDSYIVAMDGSLISPSILYLAFPKLQGIVGAQIVQEEIGRLVVKVVAEDSFTPHDVTQILNGVRSIVGKAFSVEVEKVTEIPRTPTGKARFVVSKFGRGRISAPGGFR
jgi:phenylacetate-CoA ligase